eukprot:scaffold663611_cov65-Prasinocladus_malaysianus.AAC.1
MALYYLKALTCYLNATVCAVVFSISPVCPAIEPMCVEVDCKTLMVASHLIWTLREYCKTRSQWLTSPPFVVLTNTDSH